MEGGRARTSPAKFTTLTRSRVSRVDSCYILVCSDSTTYGVGGYKMHVSRGVIAQLFKVGAQMSRCIRAFRSLTTIQRQGTLLHDTTKNKILFLAFRALVSNLAYSSFTADYVFLLRKLGVPNRTQKAPISCLRVSSRVNSLLSPQLMRNFLTSTRTSYKRAHSK